MGSRPGGDGQQTADRWRPAGGGDARGQHLLFRQRPRASERIRPAAPPPVTEDAWTVRARDILRITGVRDGYCVAWGVGSGRLIEELGARVRCTSSPSMPTRTGFAACDRLQAANVGGGRVTVLAADPLRLELPPYLASLIVAETPPRAELLPRIFHVLRPYGGVACLPLPPQTGIREKGSGIGREEVVSPSSLIPDPFSLIPLLRAKVRTEGGYVLLCARSLPGSADWTHEHADAANTRFARSTRQGTARPALVRRPVARGRSAASRSRPRRRSARAGRSLRGRTCCGPPTFTRAGCCGRRHCRASAPSTTTCSTSREPTPPAANYVTTSDGIYVAYGKVCLRLDPATGKQRKEFKLPSLSKRKTAPVWGYLNVAGDYLIGGADPLFNAVSTRPPGKKGSDVDEDNPLTKLKKKLARASNDSLSSSKHLFVLDRHTGKVLWSVTAVNGFRHNGICVGGGRRYCIDRLSGPRLSALSGAAKRRQPGHALSSSTSRRAGKSGRPRWTSSAPG